MRVIATFVLVALLGLVQYAQAVKPELFKTCGQSGFCNRNRFYASEISKTQASHYSLDKSSVKIESGVITGDLFKTISDTHSVRLPLQIDILENDSIRLRIDEDRSQIDWTNKLLKKERYTGAADWAFAQDPVVNTNAKIDADSGKFTITYGNKSQYTAEVFSKEFKIVIKLNGETQLVLNDRNLLNVEHFRTEDQNDQNLLPEESSYNAFKDDFKDSKGDTLPFGPESVALDFTFEGFKNVYGIPEHADSLSLKDTSNSEPYRLFNVDIFEYETDSRMAMYGAIPFMVAHKPGVSAGVFWVNGADTYIDIKKQQETNEGVLSHSKDTKTHWMSESGIIDVVIFIAETPEQITKNYAALTGTTALPHLFSLGYHQCRWNYNDADDVVEVHRNMDKHKFPYDTIWLDIEYTDSKKYFTWKRDIFPDPVQMMKYLGVTGRNLVTIIDPHIKTGYEVSKALESNSLAVLDKDGNPFKGHCWPGESMWIDTFNPEASAYWRSLFDNGTSFSGDVTNLHIWNDMNEPSVFSGPETTSPKDAITHGQIEIRDDHNIYGLTFHQATYEAMKARYVNKRPFILTRSYFAGSQRTTAMWTGDNMSKWEYLRIATPMILTQNIAGMPFSGADVGGFFGNPSKELLVRWYQAGIWYPFFRAHAHIDSRRREPWIAGEPYTGYMRDAVKTRYALLPLWYTQFYESSVSGKPVMTPLFYKFPQEESLFEIDDEFFIGDILVKPVGEEHAQTVDVLLPDNEMYFHYTDYYVIQGKGKHTVDAPLNKSAVFIRGGSITPRKDRYRRSSKLMQYDPYTLVVAVGQDGTASGTLYIDDGETFNYENGEFVYLDLKLNNGLLTSEVINGSMDILNKLEKVIVLGGELSGPVSVTQGGKTWEAAVNNNESHYVIKNPAVKMSESWSIKF